MVLWHCFTHISLYFQYIPIIVPLGRGIIWTRARGVGEGERGARGGQRVRGNFSMGYDPLILAEAVWIEPFYR